MNQFKKTTKSREKSRGIYFQLGLIIAGGLALVAFEWTTPVYLADLPEPYEVYEAEWDVPVIIPEEVKKPEIKEHIQAPKKSQIIKVVQNIFEPEPEPNPEPEPVFNENEFKVIEKVDEEKIHLGAEIMPEFEGGIEGLFKYLGNNLKYPNREKRAGIEGVVYLEFVVGRKGEIKNIKVLRGVNDALDGEAIRVLKAMPNWKPGKQHGKTVNVRYTMPIRFQLN